MTTLISFFYGLSGQPLYAEEGPFSWEACVREALISHPDLRSAREQLNQAMANEDIAKSASLPRISASVSSSRSDADDQAAGSSHGYSISGRQLLYDGSRTANQVAAARTALTAEQFAYDVVSSRIRLDLRIAFIKLLQARKLLSITEDIAQRRKQNLGLVELRYEAGREHRGSLLSARANLAQAEYEIQSSRRAIEQARWRLASELGRNTGQSLAIAGDISLPEINVSTPDFEKLARGNPFLNELMAQKDIAMTEKAAARSDFFPQIYAEASAGRSDSEWPPAQDSWSAGVSLSIPLFEGGSRYASLKKANSGLRQALAKEESGYHEVIYTLFTTWSDLQDAVDLVAVGEAFLNASEERARITQVEYSNGLISFDNWTIIEDDLVRDRKTCLSYLTEALIAHAYWVQAKGETLEYDLEKK
jgi:outer membrane protein TolC